MDLVIDKNFKDTYKIYYGKYRDRAVLKAINGLFNKYDPDIVQDSINTIKTCSTLGYTYTECYDKIVEVILTRFPVGDDIDKFIVSLVVKLLVAAGKEYMDSLLFSSRDIYKEAAAKHFRVPSNRVTPIMIEALMVASEKFTVGNYNIIDPPVGNWDEYFYNVCRQTARNSKCLSRRIGAVLVYDKSIISTGYNGPPRGVPRCDMRWKLDTEFCNKYKDKVDIGAIEGFCPRHVIGFKSGQGLDICPAGHAERNALINAARNGIRTKGTTLYLTCGIPCTPCLVEIINAGVDEIVVTSLTCYDETAMYLLNQSSLGVRLFSFIK